MRTIGDAIRAEGKAEGVAKARAAVVAKAWTDVRAAVKAEARAAAEAEVRTQALAEARTEARAEVRAELFFGLVPEVRATAEAEVKAEAKVKLLTLQLEHRFGDLPEEVRKQIRTAVESQLDRWFVKVLDAPTLEAMFGGDKDDVDNGD